MPGSYSNILRDRRTMLLQACLFAAWLVVVIGVSTRHEMWRDEVRALSLAMDSSSLSDLSERLTDDGHPMLWHLLLYVGYSLTSSPLVLPIIALLIAGAAVSLFVFRSPFPLWQKALFVFGGLSIYEYSVMARNYGISMLLLFTFAWLYPIRRRHAIALGVVLALLCNTNVHSIILAWLLMSLWLWDTFVTDGSAPGGSEARTFYLATAILVAGTAFSVWVWWPTQPGTLQSAVSTRPVASAVLTTITNPAVRFLQLFPPSVPAALASVVLLGSMLGLVARPFVLAIACTALGALSLFFSVIYSGSFRHQGLFVAFLVSLYWIVFTPGTRRIADSRLRNVALAGLYGGLPLLLSFLLASGWNKVQDDWVLSRSASKAFHGFLMTDPEHSEAILIGEPDYLLEAMPYYRDNPIYIVRERRFGNTVRFFRSAPSLTMGELFCAAWQLQKRDQRPVLIALGHLTGERHPWESATTSGSVSYRPSRQFSWSVEDLANWQRHTRLQQRFAENVTSDERYAVYTVVASPGHEPACQSTAR